MQDVLKEDFQKALEESTFFFFQTRSFLMGKIIKNKRDLELVTSLSSGVHGSLRKD